MLTVQRFGSDKIPFEKHLDGPTIFELLTGLENRGMVGFHEREEQVADYYQCTHDDYRVLPLEVNLKGI
jgi:hypothetical protein